MADREALARQVIDLAKAALLVDNHFLSAAVGRLRLTPLPLATPFATDGYFLAFDAGRVLARFRRTGKAPKRSLLHSVAHCLFLHPYVGAQVDQPLWDLASDIAAERMVADLLGTSDDERGAQVALVLGQIEHDLGSRISAERVYRRLREGCWHDWAGAWMELFRSDSHDLWHAPAHPGDGEAGEGAGEGTEPRGGVGIVEGDAESSVSTKGEGATSTETEELDSAEGAGFASAGGENDECHQGPTAAGQAADGNTQTPGACGGNRRQAGRQVQADDANERAQEAPRQVREVGEADGGANAHDSGRTHGTQPGSTDADVAASTSRFALRELAQPSTRQQQAEWRQVATSLAVNLQTLSAKRGVALAELVDDLRDAARQRANYEAFLRQFATPGEVMRVSPDEFDHVFYTYGLELFGDMPLIEPLEYREEQRIREFAIVIDTSASVQGETVRSFVRATFDILKATEAFFDQVHVRILQCDAQVRTDDRITSVAELREWGATMRMLGGGGTDFRPAFDYVDALVDAGEFHDLGGLLYFTDGQGTYPERPPAYRTAFVFLGDDRHDAPAPPWAVQIALDSDTMHDAEADRRT